MKDHPYVDGNKRLALVAMVAFMDRNGLELTASNAEALSVIFTVAAGAMTEGELADWVDARCRSL
jgi:death-on-curing protein